MSGEFVERLREVSNPAHSTAREMFFLNYFRDEIMSLYEAARSQREHGSGLPCEEVKDLYAALDALDAKAKGEMKSRECPYCGRSHVVKVEKADNSPYVDHYELDFRCEDCLSEWVDHIYSDKPTIHKLVKAGIP